MDAVAAAAATAAAGAAASAAALVSTGDRNEFASCAKKVGCIVTPRSLKHSVRWQMCCPSRPNFNVGVYFLVWPNSMLLIGPTQC